MPIFGPDFVEGKVYRGKKKSEQDEERLALSELQSILNAKNRRSCDCEAQVHDLLENCLNCGRLTCTAEGPGKCLSCGSLILEPHQRERLQKHIDVAQSALPDKSTPSSSTRSRAQIIDSQFDYFAIDNKKHLSEVERQNLRNDMNDLQSKRYQKRLILDVDIDNLEASAQAVRVVEDYEEELRQLQIRDEPKGLESALKMSDLVQREARKSYNLEYVDLNFKRRLDTSKTSSSEQRQTITPKGKNSKKNSFDNKPNHPRKNQKEKNEGSRSAWDRKDKSKAI